MTLTHQTGPYPQTRASEDCIDLGLGHPSPSLLPIEAFTQAAAARLGRDRLLLQYGTVRGHVEFRRALAAFLAEAGGAAVSADALMITGGTSTALSLVAQQLAQPGQRVVVGDPTYFLARGVFEGQGLGVVGVPVDGEGMSVDALERELSRGDVALIYCMPAFHNPTAVCLSARRRQRMLELAADRGAVIVADEPYNLLAYDGPPPLPLASFDGAGDRVVSLGSFSKILAPGVRLGWAHAGPELLERIASHGALVSGGGLNPVGSAIVHELIDTGELARHLERLRRTYTERSRALAGAIAAHLPGVSMSELRGGYFGWVDVGDGVPTTELLPRARAAGVAFTPGARCAVTRDLERYLRVCFAFYEQAELELGIERLAAVIAAG